MLWVGSMLVGRYFLQKLIMNEFNFDLKEHLEVIVIGIIAVTTIPVLWKVFSKNKDPKEKLSKEKQTNSSTTL